MDQERISDLSLIIEDLDRLGRLALSHEGLRNRDRIVLEACAERLVPVVVTLGGCTWIADHQNLVITGPTGIGKSFLACAFVERACRRARRRLPRAAPRGRISLHRVWHEREGGPGLPRPLHDRHDHGCVRQALQGHGVEPGSDGADAGTARRIRKLRALSMQQIMRILRQASQFSAGYRPHRAYF